MHVYTSCRRGHKDRKEGARDPVQRGGFPPEAGLGCPDCSSEEGERGGPRYACIYGRKVREGGLGGEGAGENVAKHSGRSPAFRRRAW